MCGWYLEGDVEFVCVVLCVVIGEYVFGCDFCWCFLVLVCE